MCPDEVDTGESSILAQAKHTAVRCSSLAELAPLAPFALPLFLMPVALMVMPSTAPVRDACGTPAVSGQQLGAGSYNQGSSHARMPSQTNRCTVYCAPWQPQQHSLFPNRSQPFLTWSAHCDDAAAHVGLLSHGVVASVCGADRRPDCLVVAGARAGLGIQHACCHLHLVQAVVRDSDVEGADSSCTGGLAGQIHPGWGAPAAVCGPALDVVAAAFEGWGAVVG